MLFYKIYEDHNNLTNIFINQPNPYKELYPIYSRNTSYTKMTTDNAPATTIVRTPELRSSVGVRVITEEDLSSKVIGFTRYLYEKTEVLHSLLFALLNHNREEALFWAYELYFSGFEQELAEWIRWIYTTFYIRVDTWFFEFMEINLSRLETLPNQDERDCIIGTLVSNLAHRHYDIQTFVSQYMLLDFERQPTKIHNHHIYIQFRPRDLAKYLTYTLDTNTPPREYLKIVSKYSIRKPESLFMCRYVVYASHESIVKEDTKEPYLYNWLYYAAQSPIWKSRIAEYGGMVDDTERLVIFPDDDQMELFYDTYGYEPDEQSEEMNLIHGVDAHERGIFGEQCPHEFIATYSDGKIIKYSTKQ